VKYILCKNDVFDLSSPSSVNICIIELIDYIIAVVIIHSFVANPDAGQIIVFLDNKHLPLDIQLSFVGNTEAVKTML